MLDLNPGSLSQDVTVLTIEPPQVRSRLPVLSPGCFFFVQELALLLVLVGEGIAAISWSCGISPGVAPASSKAPLGFLLGFPSMGFAWFSFPGLAGVLPGGVIE